MSKLRLTASVLLTRGEEIFWVQRGDSAPFLSRFHCFPGGAAEAGEGAEQTARRETEEELGYRPEALERITRWVAPDYLVRRYETIYFRHEVTGDPQLSPADGELSDGEWIHPVKALERWHCGRVLLAPPTLMLLQDLAAEQPFREPVRPPEASPIRPHLTLFPLRTTTLPPATHTNCYVVGTRRLAVFDPAAVDAGERARLDAFLDAHPGEVECVVLTHHHHDHVGGARYLADRLGVPIVAHRETAARVPFKVEGRVDEGDQINLGDLSLSAIHTPGHAPGHLCFFDHLGTAIVGDMVAGIGTILVDPEDGDMAEYIDSLIRLEAAAPSCLLPSHGPAMGGAVAKLREYIEHRLMREGKVLRALAPAPQGLAALTAVAYDEAPPMVRAGRNGGLAGRSVLSHLIKLESEGKAVRAGAEWCQVS